MGLLKNLTNRVITEKDSNTVNKQNKTSWLKSKIIKSIGLFTFTNYNRDAFIQPEYNLDEIREASEADSYIKMSLMKFSYLIYKAGWSLKGKDEPVSYLHKRFRYMAYSTQIPTDTMFQEIADDVVRYSNAFLIKARVDSIPGIKAKPAFGQTKVVAGYYRADPSMMVIQRDKSGNVKKYIHGYGENQRELKPEDVLHIYMDRDANNAFGTPRIIAALDDVQLLRKIEGNIISLIYRFSRPIFHWKIGLPQQGFQATNPEIKDAEREAERMSYESMLITNEKSEIKAIGAEGTALNAEGYLKYFEQRVFTALGVSETQMGRGTDKSSADSMDEQSHDVVKYIQRVIATFIEFGIIIELLYEGGYDPINNEEDMVSYEFEEISLETRIKKENHEMLMYQSNVKTLEETRRKMGMKDGVEDEERLYKNLIDKKARLEEIDRNAENQLKIQKQSQEHAKQMQREAAKIAEKTSANNTSQQASTNTGGGSKKPKSTKKDTTTKEVENKNRPENQHGKTSVKVKESINITESFKGCTEDNYKKEFNYIYKRYKDLSNDIKKKEDIDLVMPLIKEDIVREIKHYINNYSLSGITCALEHIQELKEEYKIIPKTSPILTDFYEEADNMVEDLLKDIKKAIKESNLKEEEFSVDSVFDTYEYRLRFLIDFILRKVYWYSYIKTGESLNVKKAYVLFNSDNDKENARKAIINTANFKYEDIPAYHSFCKCSVTFDKKEYDKHNIE